MIAYSQFKTNVIARIWPNGEPENLTAVIGEHILDALIDLQRWLNHLQEYNTDIHPQCATYFECGRTVIPKPAGRVKKVFTIQGTGFCDPVTYRRVELDEIECWSRDFMRIVDAPSNVGLPALDKARKYPETSTDSEFGRALTGMWAIHHGEIIIAPWMQSNESVVVAWDGLKRSFAETDLVWDEADFLKAATLYVKAQFARDFENDTQRYLLYKSDYMEAKTDLQWEHEQETRAHRTEICETEENVLWRNYLESDVVFPVENEPEDDLVFAVIGDYGEAGADELAVADLVKSWIPEFIVTTGDNNYPAGLKSTIDANVGQYYSDYIHPYVGWGSYQPTVIQTENRFWPALGNHDLDDPVLGDAYYEYFAAIPTLPANRRYYQKVIGNVHLFVLNSGQIDDSGEADGLTATSTQAIWLKDALARSTVKWRVVVVHRPPYSSDDTYGNDPTFQWPFFDWGATIVLSGHGHSYERIEVDGNPYIVNGLGGTTIRDFDTPIDESILRYNDAHGALKVTYDCLRMKFEFISVDGDVIDTLEIAG